MMMYKRDLYYHFASLDQPILAYCDEFGTSSYSIFVNSSHSNYNLIFYLIHDIHSFFFVLPCSILASLMEEV